jgi:chromosome segregation ATPase
MTQDSLSRIDQLEALAQTILLSIQALAQRDAALAQRQETTQDQLDQLKARFDDVAQQQNANAAQIAANSEQIALNAAGMVELRNLIADMVRGQR